MNKIQLEARQKYELINFYISFFMVMAIGGACGYYGLAMSLTVIAFVKIIPIYEQYKGRALSEQQAYEFNRTAKISCGAILGSLTGYVFLPALLTLLIKLKDKRLQLNKNSLYMNEMKPPNIPLSVYLIFGVIIAKIVMFLDIQMLRAILLVGFAIAIFFIQIKQFDIARLEKILQGKKIIKNQDQYIVEIFGNMMIAYLVVVYSFINISTWACIAYIIWLIISQKVYQASGFKFQQQKSLQHIESSDPSQTGTKIQQIIQALLCPISSQPIQNPYTIKECGHTFEKQQIQRSLQTRDACPLCNTRTSQHNIVENKMMKQIMNEIQKQLGPQFLDNL